ncbi:MAG: TolC family protein [Bacteroidota bacterium]
MKRYFAIICSILFSSSYSQENSVLSFSEAVKIALENNVTLKTQKNEQYVNQAQKNAAMASVGPTLSAFAQGSRVLGNQFIEQEARVVNNAETQNFFGSVTANITVFNGFNRINTVRQANASLEAQQHFVNRTRQDVITNVSNQYLQCLLDVELLTIAKQDLETQKTQLKQVDGFVEAGTRAKVDSYNQMALVKSSELTVFRAEVQLRNDKLLLSQTLLIEPEMAYELDKPDWTLNLDNFEGLEIDNLVETALGNRGDYLRAEKSELAAKRGVSIAFSNFLPTISGYGRVGSRYSDASIPTFETQMDDNLRKEYGLSVDIPIFSGLRNRQTRVRAKVSHDNAQLNTESIRLQVKSDVLRAYQGYQDALTNFEVSEAQLEAAQISFGLEKERYEIGNSDLVLFTQANQRLTQAKGDFAQAKYTLLFQDILLQYATGTLQIEDIP